MSEAGDKQNEILIAYGRHMADLRRRAGLSLREVAQKAGVDKNTVMRLESGLPVRNASRERICRCYGVFNIMPAHTHKSDVGKHYAKSQLQNMLWHRAKVKTDDLPSDISSSSKYNNSEERLRQGKLHLAQQFFSRLDCNRPTTKLRAGVFEVFGTSGRSSQPTGEALIYVLKGVIRFEIGDEECIIQAGESITFDRTVPHLHEPYQMDNDQLPAVFLYVQVE